LGVGKDRVREGETVVNKPLIVEISCEEVWREISNYIDEAIEPELHARMEAHFKVCGHCAAVLDGSRNVIKLIADDQTYVLPAGFGERLYRKLKDL